MSYSPDAAALENKARGEGGRWWLVNAKRAPLNNLLICNSSQRRLLFNHLHNTVRNPQSDHLSSLQNWGQEHLPVGLRFHGWLLRGQCQKEWVGSGEAVENEAVTKLSEAFSPKKLDGSFKLVSVVLIRREPYYTEEYQELFDNFWIELVQNNIFNVSLPHQIWMQKPGKQNADQPIKRYATHPARYTFPSLEHYELTLGAALVHEIGHEREVIAKYFSPKKMQYAFVYSCQEGQIFLMVEIPQDGDLQELVPGDKMDLHIKALVDDNYNNISPRTGSPGTIKNASVFKVINAGKFILEIRSYVSYEVRKHWLRRGSWVEMGIQMQQNLLPAQRQLMALERIVQQSQQSKRQKLQNLLLHGSMPHNEDALPKHTLNELSAEEFTVWSLFMDSQHLNTRQTDAVLKVVDNNFSLVIGPPGTGKTSFNGVVTTACSASGHKTEQVNNALRNLVVQDNALRGVPARMADRMGLLVLPTLSGFKRDMYPNLEKYKDHRMKNWVVPDQYKLWPRMKAHIEREAQRGEAEYIQWLRDYQCIAGGGRLEKAADMTKYQLLLKKVQSTVIENGGVNVIVSTCNNSALLWDLGKWKPDIALIDECAYALEMDSLISLSHGAANVLIVGDHNQLRPLVKSRGFQEYAQQHSTSLFERLVHLFPEHVVMLNENYRSHPDVSDFVYKLTYGHVENKWASVPSNVAQDVNFAVEEVFQQSRLCQHLGITRRDPTLAKYPKQNRSLLNYANVNAILAMVRQMYATVDQQGNRVVDLTKVVIITGYHDQMVAIRNALRLDGFDDTNGPSVKTIDTMQGNENNWIIFDMTTANPNHGADLGFVGKDWHRLNVALTRAQNNLWIVGNLDLWWSELNIIYAHHDARNLACFLLDLVQRGNVLDCSNVDADHISGDDDHGDEAVLAMPSPEPVIIDPEVKKLKAEWADLTKQQAFLDKLALRVQKVYDYAETERLAFLANPQHVGTAGNFDGPEETSAVEEGDGNGDVEMTGTGTGEGAVGEGATGSGFVQAGEDFVDFGRCSTTEYLGSQSIMVIWEWGDG
ncbi:hypothetical protein HYALB_00007603 [Hymenoscyphus albidus]|uniref:Uncharacterized protein n=1 Tax=Hymenoscyphus albidus TaxID=595503 RepID=A0A9N9Q5Y6_9HELO|nr:hypothetical protein HYALB_00007603 [Hymenoscyphus albidus]